MLTLLSPSKTLNCDTSSVIGKATVPSLLEDTKTLATILKGYSQKDLQALMGVSEKIAALNVERYQSFATPFTEANAKQAIQMFKGDVYDGLDAPSLAEEDLVFAQEHLRILSGLYGVIRPLDLIQPYRLEMGTKLENDKGKNLYSFWGDKITSVLEQEKPGTVVNLASKEYFSAVDPNTLNAGWITPVFKEYKKGDYKVIGLLAKRARGMMARYIIQHRIDDAEKLKQFTEGGYAFAEDMSSSDTWVFTRKI